MDVSKRMFFKRGILEGVRSIFRSFHQGIDEARNREHLAKFFQSYESSYPLTLGYPDDILLETAKRAGIKTEGREKTSIMRELFEKTGAL